MLLQFMYPNEHMGSEFLFLFFYMSTQGRGNENSN